MPTALGGVIGTASQIVNVAGQLGVGGLGHVGQALNGLAGLGGLAAGTPGAGAATTLGGVIGTASQIVNVAGQLGVGGLGHVGQVLNGLDGLGEWAASLPPAAPPVPAAGTAPPDAEREPQTDVSYGEEEQAQDAARENQRFNAALDERRREVEDQVRWEIAGQEAREASLDGEMIPAGWPARRGPARGMGSGGFEMVRNGDWDGALNVAADPFGLLGELPALKADLAQMAQNQAMGRINDLRQRMIDAGVKNVPENEYNIGASTGVDYQRTVDKLGGAYEDHLRDQRLRENWGEDYQNIRIGKSQMSVLEFEKKVLDIHQAAADAGYAEGLEAIAKGRLKVEEGRYAKVLGTYMDEYVRVELRTFAQSEGINDSSASNIWAINRRISSDSVPGYDVPDGRIGNGLYHDTSLTRKDGYTAQLQKWNAIRKGDFLIIRPSQMPGGGAYAVPQTTIQPYAPSTKIPGKKS